MIIFLIVSFSLSGFVSFQYRNDTSGSYCGDEAPIGNVGPVEHTFRDFFFQEDKVWGSEDEGYYKGITSITFGRHLHMENCTDIEGTGCSNATYPCYSRYAVPDNERLDGLQCIKYIYPCSNDSGTLPPGEIIRLRPRYSESLDSLPNYVPRRMFLTVWDEDPDCTRVSVSNIIAGRNYKSWDYTRDNMTTTYGVPPEWSVLGEYDYEDGFPDCKYERWLQIRCEKNRMFIDTFPSNLHTCGGDANATYTAEEWFYGENPVCSWENMKFVCGDPPFTFSNNNDDVDDDEDIGTVTSSLCLILLLISLLLL